jgi:hypothetical protein
MVKCSLWKEKVPRVEDARYLTRERDRERARADELQHQLCEAKGQIATLERELRLLGEK